MPASLGTPSAWLLVLWTAALIQSATAAFYFS